MKENIHGQNPCFHNAWSNGQHSWNMHDVDQIRLGDTFPHIASPASSWYRHGAATDKARGKDNDCQPRPPLGAVTKPRLTGPRLVPGKDNDCQPRVLLVPSRGHGYKARDLCPGKGNDCQP